MEELNAIYVAIGQIDEARPSFVWNVGVAVSGSIENQKCLGRQSEIGRKRVEQIAIHNNLKSTQVLRQMVRVVEFDEFILTRLRSWIVHDLRDDQRGASAARTERFGWPQHLLFVQVLLEVADAIDINIGAV